MARFLQIGNRASVRLAPRRYAMFRTLCRVLGVVFVLAGLTGFADPNLLGLHLTPAHNVIHILSGLVTLYVGFAGSNGCGARARPPFWLGVRPAGPAGVCRPRTRGRTARARGAARRHRAGARQPSARLAGRVAPVRRRRHPFSTVGLPNHAVEPAMMGEPLRGAAIGARLGVGIPLPDPRPLPSPVRPPSPYPDPGSFPGARATETRGRPSQTRSSSPLAEAAPPAASPRR